MTPFPPAVVERLSPETLELTQCAHFTHVKDVAMMEQVTLDGSSGASVSAREEQATANGAAKL